jgi:hypothetical protein
MGWWRTKEDMVNGDTPADIFDVAIKKCIDAWEAAYGRPPYKEELETTLSFCLGGHDEVKEHPEHKREDKPQWIGDIRELLEDK